MTETTSDEARTEEKDMDPSGKVALVTGAGSGIGRATAIALAGAGAAVAVADVDEEGGRETVRMIEETGGRAAFVRVDVTRREDIEKMVSFAEDTFGGLDILHNNAGVSTPPPRYPEAPIDLWERTLAIDLWAVIAGTQAAVPAMKRRGGGVIVNTASVAGLIAYIPDPIYAAVKHGVVGFSRSLTYLKPEANIRVNCVCPGVVNTPMIRKGMDTLSAEERAQREAMMSQMPLIPPEEIADAVLEFVRDESLNGEAMGVTYGRPRKLVPPPIRFQRDPAQR
jgi:NAD(P)-dependent dehydrogenase (short-subunit alcohol dehydrogenase family)